MLTSYELAHEVGTQLWDQIDYSPLVLGMKGLACVFLLYRWISRYYKSLRDSSVPKFDYWDILYGVGYIMVVFNCDLVLQAMDGAMVEIGNWMLGGFPMPDSEFDMFQDSTWAEISASSDQMGEEGIWATISNALMYIISLDWIYDAIAMVCMLGMIVVDSVAFLVREAMIIVAKLFMPIVMACAVIPAYKDKALRFVMIYLAIYLTGYLYILSIGFCNAAFTIVLAPLLAELNFFTVGTGTNAISDVVMLVPKVLLLLICLKAKIEMIKESKSLAFRILA